jgi:hypothetical protein
MKNVITNIIGSAAVALAISCPFVAKAETHTKTRAGTFTGASDYITTGGIWAIKTVGGGAVAILDNNFSLDGAPDPRVGF